jgi:DNA segregation ATPase FtsK/SpoIIIE-like protein
MGRGDSLMVTPSVPLRRLHGTFVTEEELARVVKFVKNGKDHSKSYISFAGSRPEE